MNKRQMVGAMVAMAVAGMLAANSGLADDKKAEKKADAKKTMKCAGGNACGGKGACASADGSNSCAGKNSCKGKGWTNVSSEAECTKAGGKVVTEEKKKAEEPKKS
jgi:uncharacterized membrane protein